MINKHKCINTWNKERNQSIRLLSSGLATSDDIGRTTIGFTRFATVLQTKIK